MSNLYYYIVTIFLCANTLAFRSNYNCFLFLPNMVPFFFKIFGTNINKIWLCIFISSCFYFFFFLIEKIFNNVKQNICVCKNKLLFFLGFRHLSDQQPDSKGQRRIFLFHLSPSFSLLNSREANAMVARAV